MQLLEEMERVRAIPDFVRCWSVPESSEVYYEDLGLFEQRLEACEQYYEQFLTRRLSSWGRYAVLIEGWMAVVRAEIREGNHMKKMHQILTQNLINQPGLRSKLEATFAYMDEQDQEIAYQKVSLQRALERGEGICVDLFLPPMGRFARLLHGIEKIIVNQQNGLPISQFMEDFLSRTESPSQILIMYLVQHLCCKFADAEFTFDDDGRAFYSSHLGQEIELRELLDSWSTRVLSGRCRHDSLYIMKLVHEFDRLNNMDLPGLSILNFRPISDMLVENCLKTWGWNVFSIERIDFNANRLDLFMFYKHSWELLNRIKEIRFEGTDSVLTLLDIRSPNRLNSVDRLFFETNNPLLVDAYIQGKGLCLTYGNDWDFYHMTMNRIVFLQTLDRAMAVRGYQLIYSSRLLAFYLMLKVCEQAKLLPLVG